MQLRNDTIHMKKRPLPIRNQNRATNLRQCLLRASRLVNIAIVEGLHRRGFIELRSTHTALLSNLDLEGNSLTTISQRAGITKQAMGRLADELVKLNYITRTRSVDDKRLVKIELTPSGLKLMKHSFTIMDELENRCSNRIGINNLKKLLNSLKSVADEFENI